MSLGRGVLLLQTKYLTHKSPKHNERYLNYITVDDCHQQRRISRSWQTSL